MWELDCEESWAPKNWCFWIVVLEKTLESPLDYKEIQPVHSEGDQPWDFFGRNDAKAETPVLGGTSCEELTHWKRLWCWEGLGAGGGGDDRGWDGWMASLTWWIESGWTPGVDDGQGGLVCCDSWGRKELDTTERLNWKIKPLTVSSVSSSICHEVMGQDAMILDFWMLSFKPTFSLSSFTFIKRLFSSS